MRRKNHTLMYFLTALLLVLLLHACAGPDPEPPLQTHILGVKVEPNPVAVGDTATFTCIIEDSLDGRFKYKWLFAGNSFEDTTTHENHVYWIAQGDPGNYDNYVNVDNGDQDSRAPGKSFTITVTK